MCDAALTTRGRGADVGVFLRDQFPAVFHRGLPGDAVATATYLAFPEVRKFGDKSFLVGSRFELTDPDPRRRDSVIWIALDEVSGIMPFPTAERIKEYLDSKKQPRRSLGGSPGSDFGPRSGRAEVRGRPPATQALRFLKRT